MRFLLALSFVVCLMSVGCAVSGGIADSDYNAPGVLAATEPQCVCDKPSSSQCPCSVNLNCKTLCDSPIKN